MRRNPKHNAETYTKYKGDDCGIIIPAKVMGDGCSCPYSDENEDRGYHWADNTSNDDVMSTTGNILRNLRRHVIEGFHPLDGRKETKM